MVELFLYQQTDARLTGDLLMWIIVYLQTEFPITTLKNSVSLTVPPFMVRYLHWVSSEIQAYLKERINLKTFLFVLRNSQL